MCLYASCEAADRVVAFGPVLGYNPAEIRVDGRRCRPNQSTDTDQPDMPRPTKAYSLKRRNAAAAWKRGEKKEAYKLWEEASASSKEHLAKKKNKKQAAAAVKAAEAAAAEEKAAAAS